MWLSLTGFLNHGVIALLLKGIQGTVLVKALVTEQGLVEALQVEPSAGHAGPGQSAVEVVQR